MIRRTLSISTETTEMLIRSANNPEAGRAIKPVAGCLAIETTTLSRVRLKVVVTLSLSRGKNLHPEVVRP